VQDFGFLTEKKYCRCVFCQRFFFCTL